MRASLRTVVLVAGASAVLVLAGLTLPGELRRSRAVDAVRAYDEALSGALSSLDPRVLEPAAEPAEVQRVANYVTLLWGTGKRMDARLLSLAVDDVTSAEQTVTAEVTERWAYREYDRRTGKPLGAERTEAKRLEYVLRPRAGKLVVFSATKVQPGEER